MSAPVCRSCSAPLSFIFIDLGTMPPCESYIGPEHTHEPQPVYPLRVFVCEACYLAQLEPLVSPQRIFTEYAYFASYSDTWVGHAAAFTAGAIDRFRLGRQSFVVEVGSNDGYLLQHFVAAGIPCLGIDPAANVAAAARERGVTTEIAFFGKPLGRRLAAEGRRADLIVANNVLAQVPDLHAFVAGLRLLLKPGGVITIEFPHLLRLMAENQFDTIYHEHFSYFSFLAAERVLAQHRLRCFDVDKLATHGGSLRLYVCHRDDAGNMPGRAVAEMRAEEHAARLDCLDTYSQFAERILQVKRDILRFLADAKNRGCRIAGYGAPGKGNTLLNYCGVGTDFIDYTVDRNPYKQGKLLPGSRIPVHHPDKIMETRPDYVFILPWNLKEEVMEQMRGIRAWGGRFVIPIPRVAVVP
jgi:SAM-dependent methyltransferase